MTHSFYSISKGKTLIFCAAPLPLPAKVTDMDESASQALLSHSTSFFSPGEKGCFSTSFFFSWFFWFPGFLLSAAPISLWFSPSFTFTLSYYSIFYDVGIKFFERPTEKLRVYQASESVLTRILSLILTISLSSFLLRRTSKSCGLGRGPVTRWTSEDL